MFTFRAKCYSYLTLMRLGYLHVNLLLRLEEPLLEWFHIVVGHGSATLEVNCMD